MIVEINNLVKRYDKHLAVDNLNLRIKQGSIFGLLGPNGAGKTTTIKAIMGLISTDSGQVTIFSQDMSTHATEVKKDIGIVPQKIAVFYELTVRENIEFFGRLYGLKGKALNAGVNEALEFVGLKEHEKKLASSLSGGMLRRLNIACAVVHKPKLIIMDEPTVGIDPQSRNHILESVKALNRKGTTIIYTSHYMEEIEAICDDITIMDHGRVIAQGSKETLKDLIGEDQKQLIDISGVSYSVVDDIKNISGVRECQLEDGQLVVLSDRNAQNMNQIIESIMKRGGIIKGLKEESISLEDVFLTLTGRLLRD